MMGCGKVVRAIEAAMARDEVGIKNEGQAESETDANADAKDAE